MALMDYLFENIMFWVLLLGSYTLNYAVVSWFIHPAKKWKDFSRYFVLLYLGEYIILLLFPIPWFPFLMLSLIMTLGCLVFWPLVFFSSGLIRYSFHDRMLRKEQSVQEPAESPTTQS